MSKFSLLSRLEERAKKEAAKDPNAPNIVYERYELTVTGKDVAVLIPERECTNFENSLTETTSLTMFSLKNIVRDHRGIIER